MGARVAGKIDEKANQATTSLSGLNEKFNTQVNSNKVVADDDLINRAASDATNFVKNSYDLNRFTQMRDASYKGPKSFLDLNDDYSQTQNAFNQANQFVNDAQSEDGRMNLVKGAFDRPNYTRGAQKLDQLLLQNSPEAKETLNTTANRYKDLMGVFNTAQTTAQSAAADAEAQTLQARNKVQTAFGREDDPNTLVDERAGALGQFQTDLDNKVTNFRNSQSTLNTRLGTQAPTGELDQDILSMFGLQNNQRLFDVNLQDFVNPYVDTANVQRVANADDYAKYSALQQLINGTGNTLYDPSMAGTASSVGVDAGRLKSTLENKDSLLTNTYNGLKPAFELLQGAWPANFTGTDDQTIGEMQKILNSVETYGVSHPDDVAAVNSIKSYIALYNQLNPNRKVKQR